FSEDAQAASISDHAAAADEAAITCAAHWGPGAPDGGWGVGHAPGSPATTPPPVRIRPPPRWTGAPGRSAASVRTDGRAGSVLDLSPKDGSEVVHAPLAPDGRAHGCDR